MRLVVLVNVEHDGVSYTPGEIIEDIKKADGERLLKLEVAKELDIENEVEKEDKEIEKKAISKKKASNDKEKDES